MVETNIPSLDIRRLNKSIQNDINHHKSIESCTKNSPYYMIKKNPIVRASKAVEKPFEYKDIYKVSDFTKYDDQVYISNLYRGIFKREPDRVGLAHNLELLRLGELSKVDILLAMRLSDEGMVKNVIIGDIKKHRLLSKLYCIPLLGLVIQALSRLSPSYKGLKKVCLKDSIVKDQEDKDNPRPDTNDKLKVTKKSVDWGSCDEVTIDDKGKAIHQLLPYFAQHDAISNQAMMIQKLALLQGYRSKIFVLDMSPNDQNICELFHPKKLNDNDALIYHHTSNSPYTDIAISHRGKKALIYHNITPNDFYEPYSKSDEDIAKKDHDNLKKLADVFDMNYANSPFSATQLQNNNFKNPTVLTPIIPPSDWGMEPDQTIVDSYSDTKNILFKGSLSPEKKQSDLLRLMCCLTKIDPQTRLILVGDHNNYEPYIDELSKLIDTYELDEQVAMIKSVRIKEQKSYYMVADLFVSMSEFESFGAHFIEAMWFDIPIIAYDSTAVKQTLGEVAVTFTDKKDMLSLAILTQKILENKDIQNKIITAQRQTRERFVPKHQESNYQNLINGLTDV